MAFMLEENETAQAIAENSSDQDDVVKKFEKYRSRAEVIYVEFKEAKLAIDRLREELNLCQTTEKFYSHQILSLKSQLSALEEKAKNFFTLSKKQQRVIDERIQKNDEKLTEINNIIRKLKTNYQNLISSTNRDLHLVHENKYLKAAVQSREESMKLITTDIKKLLNEKEELVQKNLIENSRLNDELNKSRLEADEIRDFCSKSINSYRKQIEEYENVIELMEKERKRLFAGDYETNTVPIETYNKPEHGEPDENEKVSTRPDSTMFPEARGNKSVSNLKDFDKLPIQAQSNTITKSSNRNSSSSNNNNSSNSKIQKMNSALTQPQTTSRWNSKFRKSGMKQRQQLEFFEECEDSISQPKPKRRLYSENNNHYLF